MSYGKSIDFLLNQMRNAVGSLEGGTVTFYDPGTTTKKAIYLDREMTVSAANPYTLTSDGTAELFALGVYRVVFKSSGGSSVYDYDNVAIGTDLTNTVLLYADTDSPVDISTSTDVIIVKTDATANVLNIIDTSGNTIMGIAGNTGIDLTVQNESIHLTLPNGETDWKRI